MLTSHIKTKISGYKQQDVFKKKLDEPNLVKFEEVIDLLNKCEMKCHYCSEEVFILYERVREMKQWTLDRVNNDIGHNSGNVVITSENNLLGFSLSDDLLIFLGDCVILISANKTHDVS